MGFLTFLPRYLLWHYSVALLDFARAATNLFWFLAHFFSLELLAKTFFVPWKRLGETQGMWVGRVIVNSMMRFVGAGMRFGVFLCAAISYSALIVAVLVAFVLWITLPLVIAVLLVIGVRALIV